MDACGAYIILVALLGLVVCSPRTLSTLGFLAIGLGCVIKPLPVSPVRAFDERSVCPRLSSQSRGARAAKPQYVRRIVAGCVKVVLTYLTSGLY